MLTRRSCRACKTSPSTTLKGGWSNTALQYPGVSSITRIGDAFGFVTIHPPLSFKRAGRVCDFFCFIRSHARQRLVGDSQSHEEISLVANNTVLAEGEGAPVDRNG